VSIVDSEGFIDAKVWSRRDVVGCPDGEKKPVDTSSPDISGLFLGACSGSPGHGLEFRGKQQFQFSEVFLLDPERFSHKRFIRSSACPGRIYGTGIRRDGGLPAEPEIRKFLENVFSGELWNKFRTCQRL
jgi:hypothetical protein